MASEGLDFGIVTRIEPDAVGVPGQRRFRIVVSNGARTAHLWIEKEQLQALGLAVEQMLSQLKILWSTERKEPNRVDPGHPDFECRVGRLGLGFDEAQRKFVLVAHDVEADQEAPPTFRCLADRSHLQVLIDGINALVSAGRPRCPLCGAPLDEGPHFCPGSNGHAH